MNHLSRFRKIAFLEGLSLLVLLFIAMPLKYIMGNPLAVKWVGWAHGVLFILYCIWLYLTGSSSNWKLRQWLMAFIAAWLPFGTFWLEAKIKQNPDQWS